MAAGAMAATVVTAAAEVGLGNRRWRWWFDGAKWAPPVPRAGRREGAVVQARVASMVAHSGAVVARGVALMIGPGIEAMAAANGGRLSGGGDLHRPRVALPRYLLKGRGRGRMVTQRRFGHMRSLAGQSAATLKVAVSGAAHVHLSPTGGRAKRVVSMGRSGGCEVGKGGRSSLGAGVRWLDGRKRAGQK